MAKQVVTMYMCDMCGSYINESYGYFNMHMKEDHDLPIRWLDLCEDCYSMITLKMKLKMKKISFRKADDYRIFHDGDGWKPCGYNEEEGAGIEWLR